MNAAPSATALLAQGVRALAGMDSDRASVENGVGFSRVDGAFGHRMAELDPAQWTPRQTRAVWEMLRRYRNTQLPAFGIDFAEIPEPPKVTQTWTDTYNPRPSAIVRAVEPSTIELAAGKFTFRFGVGDPDFYGKKDAVKLGMVGARFDPDRKCWTAPVSLPNIECAADILSRYADAEHPFTYADDLPDRLDAVLRTYTATVSQSHAKSSEYIVAGLHDNVTLFPFQRAGVEFGVQQKRFINADDMGLGKTPQAIGVIADQSAFPALLIVPANLKLNWKREIEAWCENSAFGRNGPIIQIANGVKQIAIAEPVDILICNYDILGSYDGRTKAWTKSGWGEALSEMPWSAVVCDEAHLLKNPKAQRTKAVKQIVKASDPELVMLLTGTPMKNRPIELWPLIELVGREDAFGGFMQYAKRYCDAFQEVIGPKVVWNFQGASNMLELNDVLRSNGTMIQRRKPDVMPELPPRAFRPVAMEMSKDGAARYRKIAADIAGWVAGNKANDVELVAKWDFEAHAAGLTGDALKAFIDSKRSEYVRSETFRQRRSEQLLKFNVLKQEAYRAKRDSIFAWVDNFVESSDESLVIFGWHREFVDELAERYGWPKIQGGMPNAKVEENKRAFQAHEVRGIVCNIAAGGVGHTLHAASNVAFVEFGWSPSDMDQALDRVHRIGQDLPCTGWLLKADGTIEDVIANMIAAKRETVMAGTSGRGEAEQTRMLRAVQDSLLTGVKEVK